jgi:hypothetical protein
MPEVISFRRDAGTPVVDHGLEIQIQELCHQYALACRLKAAHEAIPTDF